MMFPPVLRWILSILAVAWGAHRVSLGLWEWAIFIAGGLFMALGYWREGSVWLAFRAMTRGDLPLARRRLQATPQTRLLTAQNRAYQDWVWGAIHLGEQRFAEARRSFEAALAGALRTDNDRAILHCILAEVAQGQGDAAAQEAHLTQARRLDRDGRVKAMIQRIEAGAAGRFMPESFEDL